MPSLTTTKSTAAADMTEPKRSRNRTEEVARWVASRPEGADCHEIAVKFGITARAASSLICHIKRCTRYTTTTTPFVGAGRASKNKQCARLFVHRIVPPVFNKKEHGPVVGINDAALQTVEFVSAAAAQRDGGFCADNILKCCKNQRRKHAGYHWHFKYPDHRPGDLYEEFQECPLTST